MRVQTIQHAFNNGELSPLLNTRSDINPYQYGAKEITNCYVLPQGGLTKRGGLQHVDFLKDSTKPVKLIPFNHSRNNEYVLCLNAGVIQFLKNKQFIKNGSTRVQLTHPYTDSQLNEIKYTQYQSVMYITHPDHPPKQLIRTSDTVWSISDIDVTYNALSGQTFDNGFITFKIVSTPFTDFRSSSTTNNIVNSSNVVTQSTTSSTQNQIKKHFKTGDKFTFTTDGSGNMTTPVSTIADGFEVGYIIPIDVYADNDPAQTWTITLLFRDDKQERWSVVGSKSGQVKVQWYSNNYPAVCSFHEQRLYFASTKYNPLRIWGSKIGDFLDFTLGLDDDGVQFDIDNNTRDHIVSLESGRVLLPMTRSAEFTMTGNQDSGITSQTVRIRRQTTKGSSDIKPKQIDEEILFVDKTQKRVNAISYDLTTDTNIAPDLTTMSNHISGKGFVDMTQQYSKNLMWLVNKDGQLVSLCHIREQNVTGWTKHTTQNGKFVAVTCIESADEDIVYVVVDREGEYHLDILNDDVQLDDCDVIKLTTPSKSITTHFEAGDVVHVKADGNDVGEKQVQTGGVITLDHAASEIQVGYTINSKVQLYPVSIVTRAGSTVGVPQRVINIITYFHNSIGIIVQDVLQEQPIVKYGETVQPQTGEHHTASLGWDEPIVIKHNSPYPMTILGVSYSVVLGKQAG